MFWWTDRYRPVAVPNYDLFGSPAYYAVAAIQQLALFSVPAFLFVSGFFVAYAARGQGNDLSWKIVRTRITGLLWPYFIWMMVYLVVEALQGRTYALIEYVRRVLTGDVAGPFYFVPLLGQFYLLSPFIVRWAKNRPVALLSIAVAVQVLGRVLLMYLQFANQQLLTTVLSNGWLFIWHAIYFPLGVVLGFRWNAASAVLARLQVGLGDRDLCPGSDEHYGGSMAVPDTGVRGWLANDFRIVWYLCVDLYSRLFRPSPEAKDSLPRLSRVVRGTNSYGIYLVHLLLLGWLARAIQHFIPWLLAQPVLLVFVLAAVDIALIALFMKAVARSPARKWYRYLFG